MDRELEQRLERRVIEIDAQIKKQEIKDELKHSIELDCWRKYWADYWTEERKTLSDEWLEANCKPKVTNDDGEKGWYLTTEDTKAMMDYVNKNNTLPDLPTGE